MHCIYFSLSNFFVFLFVGSLSATDQNCASVDYPPSTKENIPQYTIDLDLPPNQRWNEIAGHYSSELGSVYKHIRKIVNGFGSVGRVILNLVDEDLPKLLPTLPTDFAEEITGIATASNTSLGETVLYNVFYELFSVCTSILAVNQSGYPVHVRNMDFGLFMGWDVKNHTWELTELLRPMVINIDYKKGGQVIYKAVSFAGYIGVLTAVKPGAFTLTINERFAIDGGYVGIALWLLGIRDGKWSGWLTREVMEHAGTFTEAKHILSTDRLVSPIYFILGGAEPYEGCIITRSREKALDVWSLNASTPSVWYILETNYDRWKPAPFFDNRRQPARDCMDRLSPASLSFGRLYNVLSTRPVLNKLTVYSALMCVGDGGRLESWLRHCPDPCAPF